MSELMSMSEARGQPRCGNCGQTGHNRRTCATSNNNESLLASAARLSAREVSRRNRRISRMQEERRDEMDRARWAREEAEARSLQEVRIRRTEQAVRENERRARERAQEHDRRARETARRSAEAPSSRQGHIHINNANMQISLHAGSNTITVHRYGNRQQSDSAAIAQANRQRSPAVRAEIERLRQQAQSEDNLMVMNQVNAELSERLQRSLPVQAEPEMVDAAFLKRVNELPILRDKVVDVAECPICMETLGETGKTVLKCGHAVCQGCFLQQVLRATASKKVDSCACPVCRVNYLK